MTKRSCECHFPAYRLVGDPIDAVSGAHVDVNKDFELPGPMPLRWRRHYDTTKIGRRFALGFGHSHEFERELRFDLDGLRYIGPLGLSVGFLSLANVGSHASVGGFTLWRLDSAKYRLDEHRRPSMEFEFDGSNLVSPIRALVSGAERIAFRHGREGRLEGIVDSRGRKLRVVNDAEGHILSIVLEGTIRNSDRTVIAYAYDSAGDLVQGTDAYGNSFQHEYDKEHRLTRRKDRRGYSFHFTYDKRGRCIESRGDDGVHHVKLRYVDQHRTIVTKADGGEWSYLSNDQGALTQIINPLGGVQAFEYDDAGRLIEEVDGSGARTQHLYDDSGTFLGKVMPSGMFAGAQGDPEVAGKRFHRVASTAFEWEHGGSFARARRFTLDWNHPALARFPHKVRGLLMDDDQRRDLATDGVTDSVSSRLERNELGLLVREIAEGGSPRAWSYDENGNMTRFHDHDGSLFSFEYASWNHLVLTRGPLGDESRYSYTATERVCAVIDPLGTPSEYGFDRKDRLTSVRRREALEEYVYDHGDHLIEKRDGQGNVLVRNRFGPRGLCVERVLASGEFHGYAHDAEGRIVKMSSAAGEVTFEYDSQGRRVADLRNEKGVVHEHDVRGRSRTTMFGKFTTRFDRTTDRRVKVTDPRGRTHTIHSVGAGVLVREFSNRTVEMMRYDKKGRCVLKVAARAEHQPVAWVRSFSYSGEGDLLESKDSHGESFRCTYDAGHRLGSVVDSAGRETQFLYDRAGNLVQMLGVEHAIVGEGNRLRRWAQEVFEYDKRSRMCLRSGPRGEIRYAYDSLDQLVGCESRDLRWSASYDPFGRRTHKRHGDESCEYYWDTDRLAAEIKSDGRLRIYVYEDPLSLMPFLFIDYASIDADPKSGVAYYLSTNQIGAPVLVSDDLGQTVWSARLDPYGCAHVDPTSKIELELRFPGHFFDPETGLHYNRFRYYDPRLGRYLTPDPIGIEGGMNLYAYSPTPLSKVDVRGTNCGPVERRVWSEEELAAAERLVETLPAGGLGLAEMGKQPVELTPQQAALHAQLSDPANVHPPGSVRFPFQDSRIPMEGPIQAGDLHALTQHTGLEHGVAVDQQGQTVITRGGPNSPGIDPDETCLVHTHPHDTPPSPNDLRHARAPGQAVIGPDGRVTDYDSNGQNPHATQSPIADDGTIDGNQHEITPIVGPG